jgi:glutamate racemase
MGDGVALVDSAESVSAEVHDWFAGDAVLRAPKTARPSARFYVTDAPGPFLNVAERFLGRPVDLIGRSRLDAEGTS